MSTGTATKKIHDPQQKPPQDSRTKQESPSNNISLTIFRKRRYEQPTNGKKYGIYRINKNKRKAIPTKKNRPGNHEMFYGNTPSKVALNPLNTGAASIELLKASYLTNP